MGGYALPAEIEERQVVRSCLNGDNDGFDQLYRRYAPALVSFCERRLGNLGDAEDAAHEAILKAHRALPRFREGARLWPWMATIAANVCTDMQRSRERLESSDASEDGLAGRLLAPEVDEDVNRRLRASIVDAALDELPERFRTPLFLREFMGWSYEEIATFSNKSIGSVRTTLMRSRRAFQSRVEDVARRRGQWPLPAVVVGGWRRLRQALRSWRDSLARAGGDAANVVWRAESLLGGVGTGLQAAAVAIVAAGALATAPALATDAAAVVAHSSNPLAVAPTPTDARPTTESSAAAASEDGNVSGAVESRSTLVVDPTEQNETADRVADGTVVITEEDDGTTEISAVVGPDSSTGLPYVFSDTYLPCNNPDWETVCEVRRLASD